MAATGQHPARTRTDRALPQGPGHRPRIRFALRPDMRATASTGAQLRSQRQHGQRRQTRAEMAMDLRSWSVPNICPRVKGPPSALQQVTLRVEELASVVTR